MKSELYKKILDSIQGPEVNLAVAKNSFKLLMPTIESDYGVKILLAYVRGSHMYGTATKQSDVDITFVYQQPTDTILKGDQVPQVNFEGNDIVGFEIERFLELLGQNNPNILEALDIPEDCLIYKAPIMDLIHPKDWVSKLTEKTILGYADSQIKKATGLYKNMNNPQPKERKSILEFCYVVKNGNTVPFLEFFEKYIKTINENADYTKWGLVKMDNGKQLYALYPNYENEVYRGLVKEDSVNLRISSVDEPRKGSYTFVYNIDGFEVHCKQHKAYWEWVEERNADRFTVNQAHGKSYDSKNMMHLFRLLDMAFTIAFTSEIKVRSNDVGWLQEVKSGELEYEELSQSAQELRHQINILYEMSELQDRPDLEKQKEILLKFRNYANHEDTTEPNFTGCLFDDTADRM